MIVLDTSTILKQNHFYVLDDHLNRSGHEVIADEIIKAIETAERREKSWKQACEFEKWGVSTLLRCTEDTSNSQQT